MQEILLGYMRWIIYAIWKDDHRFLCFKLTKIVLGYMRWIIYAIRKDDHRFVCFKLTKMKEAQTVKLSYLTHLRDKKRNWKSGEL